MEDLISRQAVLDIFDDFEVGIENGMNEYEFKRKELLDLPSTDRYGEWIEDKTGNGFWICSSCGFVSEASGAWLLYKFCPNCGADMRGEQNDKR